VKAVRTCAEQKKELLGNGGGVCFHFSELEKKNGRRRVFLRGRSKKKKPNYRVEEGKSNGVLATGLNQGKKQKQ